MFVRAAAREKEKIKVELAEIHEMHAAAACVFAKRGGTSQKSQMQSQVINQGALSVVLC